MPNTYSEEIEKLKKEAFNAVTLGYHSKMDEIIDRACALSLLEGKRQQHEEDVEAVNSVPCRYVYHSHNIVMSGRCSECFPYINALASLTPRESGE